MQQWRLADEHQVMRTWEVLAQQAKFAEAVRGHEVRVINDGHKHFAGAMDTEGLLHQQPFAVMVTAFKFDLKRLRVSICPQRGQRCRLSEKVA